MRFWVRNWNANRIKFWCKWQNLTDKPFLDASTHLYMRVFPSVRRSVGPSEHGLIFKSRNLTNLKNLTNLPLQLYLSPLL